jgi:hypothetical protein
VSALAIIQIEGVLAQVYDNPNASKPIADSLLFYRALKSYRQIALVSASFTVEQAQHWLKVNDFDKYDSLSCRSVAESIIDSAEFVGQRMLAVYRYICCVFYSFF